MHDHRSVNRLGWRLLGERGCEWTKPYGPEHFEHARELLDPRGWIPWDRVDTVLCLAGGGGQQSALFASLGRKVTVLDIGQEQLERDRLVAGKYGFSVETLEGEMEDLSALVGRNFDLVYQPISAVYTPSVRRVYEQVGQVLRPGGWYWVAHWNPVCVQMPEIGEWDGSAYRLTVPQSMREVPVPQTEWIVDGKKVPCTTWQYVHTLGELIGALCETGFEILGFHEDSDGDVSAEPRSPQHVAAFIPLSFWMLARRSVVAPCAKSAPGIR